MLSSKELRDEARITSSGTAYYDPLNLLTTGMTIMHLQCHTIVAQPENGMLFCPTCRQPCDDDDCMEIQSYNNQ